MKLVNLAKYNWFFRTQTAVKRFKRSVRFLFQRMFRGFDDSETWCLNIAHAKWMVPRLERFIELHNGYPMELTPEKWIDILTKILEYFKNVRDDNVDIYDFEDKEEWKRHQENEALYIKWREHLWW